MEDLERRFMYHSPTGDQPERYQALRDLGLRLAKQIVDTQNPSREQSLALTKLEEALFWANAGIARNG